MMTRKDFLKTLAGAATVAAGGRSIHAAPTAASPSTDVSRPGMGRGVTFYSYQDELVTHRMRLEDCIAAVSDLGADGIEMVGEEGLPDYPNLSEKFVADWFGWMQKYETRPIC